MSNKTVSFFEHSPPAADNRFTLGRNEALQIQKFNRKIRQQEHLKSNVLDITWDANGEPKSIKAASYVGVIKIGRLVIEILPKIGKDESVSSSTLNLLYMLSFTKKLSVKALDIAPLTKKGNELLEVLISFFATNLLRTIERNPCKQYIAMENNITFLRGKIQFGEHLRRNSIVKSRFYTQFDEFSEDNSLNRALKYTTYLLANVCSNSRTLKKLEQILSLLTEVSFRVISLHDLEKIKLTRLNQEYEPLLNLCKLFISKSSVELSVGKISVFSLLFDMNQLFEEFVGEFIRKEFATCYESIRLQNPLRYLVRERYVNDQKTGSKFQLRPDIVLYKRIEDKTPRLIVDTKYKLLAELDGRESVGQSDMYQMYAYCQKYACPNCILLYPKWGASEEIIDYYIDDAATVHIRTIDLNRDLRTERREFKRELASILNCA